MKITSGIPCSSTGVPNVTSSDRSRALGLQRANFSYLRMSEDGKILEVKEKSLELAAKRWLGGKVGIPGRNPNLLGLIYFVC